MNKECQNLGFFLCAPPVTIWKKMTTGASFAQNSIAKWPLGNSVLQSYEYYLQKCLFFYTEKIGIKTMLWKKYWSNI